MTPPGPAPKHTGGLALLETLKREQALAMLPEQASAVYLLPLPHMSEQQIRELARGFVERRLPSFTAHPGEVELGILATKTDTETLNRLARRVAILMHRILLGEDAGTLPVLFERGSQLLIEALRSEIDPDETHVVLFAEGDRPPEVPHDFLWVQGEPTKESELAKARVTHASSVIVVGSRAVSPR